jgi:hypothetical protein
MNQLHFSWVDEGLCFVEVPCRTPRVEVLTPQRNVRELAENPGDAQALQALKTAVEIQLALADLRIKVRQADHAKTITWLPAATAIAGVVIGGVGAIGGALISGWLKHRAATSSFPDQRIPRPTNRATTPPYRRTYFCLS